MNNMNKNIAVRIYPALSSVFSKLGNGLVTRQSLGRYLSSLEKGLRLRNYTPYQSLISKTW